MNKKKILSPMLIILLSLSLIVYLTPNFTHSASGASSKPVPIELPFSTGFEEQTGSNPADPLGHSNLVDWNTSNFYGFNGQGSQPTCQPVDYSSQPAAVRNFPNALNRSFFNYGLRADGYFGGSYSYCYFDLFDSSPNIDYQLPVQLQQHTYINIWYYHASLSCCMIDGELYNAGTNRLYTLRDFNYSGQLITDQNGIRIHPAARINDPIGKWESACFDLSVVTASDPGPWYLTKLWIGMDNGNHAGETGQTCTYFDLLDISYGVVAFHTEVVKYTDFFGDVMAKCNANLLVSAIAFDHYTIRATGKTFLDLKVTTAAWTSNWWSAPLSESYSWVPYTLMTNVTNPQGSAEARPTVDIVCANITAQPDANKPDAAPWVIDGILLLADVASGPAAPIVTAASAGIWAAEGIAMYYQSTAVTPKYTYHFGNAMGNWVWSDYGEVAVDVLVPHAKTDTISVDSWATINACATSLDPNDFPGTTITTIHLSSPVSISWTEGAGYQLPTVNYGPAVGLINPPSAPNAADTITAPGGVFTFSAHVRPPFPYLLQNQTLTGGYVQAELNNAADTGTVFSWQSMTWTNGITQAAEDGGNFTGSFTFAPSQANLDYHLIIKAVGTNGAWISTTDQLIYYDQPSISITPSTVTMDVGQSQTFTATVTGGTPWYSYWWGSATTPIGALSNAVNHAPNYSHTNAASTTYTFTPSSKGTYYVACYVNDSVGGYAYTYPGPIVTVNTALSVNISPPSVTLSKGQSPTFTSTVSGGTQSYSYQWCLNGNPVTGATTSSWAFNQPTPGSYMVCLKVTDGAGFTATSNTAVVIAGYNLQISANDSVPKLTFTLNGTAISGSVNIWNWAGTTYTITVSPTQYYTRISRYYIMWEFVGWSDGYQSTTRTITLNKNMNLIADYYFSTNLPPGL